MSYTDQQNVEAALQRVLTDEEVTILNLAIPAAEQYINLVTGRVFEVDEEDTARYYDGGHRELFIEPMDSITKVEYVDHQGYVQTLYDPTTDYYLTPRGRKPITSIVFNWHTPHGIQNIRVTGKFGQEVPDPIVLVATKLVVMQLQNTENIKREEIEGYSKMYFDKSIENDWAITSVLEAYTRYTL